MDTSPKNNTAENENEIRESAKRQALEKLKQKAVIVNVDELAEAEARKAADAYMTESKENLKGIKNLVKKIWKHTFFDEYYRQREVSRVQEEIKDSKNIYVGRNGEDRTAHENAMQAISERFASEYEGTLSEGEEKETLDNKNPEQVKIKTDIKNLINEYAKGNLNEEAFNNQKVRILDGLNGGEDGKKSKNNFNNYADNLLELAQNARLAIKHGADLEELKYDFEVIIGKAKSSLKTEAHFNKIDKCIDKMKKSKIGRFVSPAVLNTSIGLAYSLSILLTKKAASLTSSIVPLLGSVAVSSAFAGMNESQRLAAERAQHGIEMAEGSEFEEGSKKREQMDGFNYQMESSNELASNLRNLIFEKGEDGKEILKDIKQEDLEKIFANLANIEARNSLNAKNKIDLISYSGIGNVEKERTDLTILVARAKVELRKKIESDLKNGITKGKTFDQYLNEQTQIVEDSLLGGEKGITAQDKAFKKFKSKEVAKKIVKTATFGFIIGGTVQEALAFGNDDVQGMFEGISHHDPDATIQTPLDHIKDWITGDPTHMGMEGAVETVLSNGHQILLPEGTSILENPDGTFDILRGNNVISDNIKLNFDTNGNLDSDSLIRLGEVGIVGNTTHTIIDGTKEVTSDAKDYIDNHSESVRQIARDGWYDNNTPKPIFDQNELKLQWGGESGSAGIDTDGNYVLDVSHMTSGGSFNQEFSIDAQEAIKNGDLKIILSLTQGTQHQVFEVPIDTNGNAVIDPNSEIGKLFFGEENGHAIFKGRFAEVVQSFGDKDGVEHVKSLATLVGDGNDSIHDVIPTHIDVPVTNLDIPVGVQPPLFIPIMSRRPLESLKEKKNNENIVDKEKKEDDSIIKKEEEDLVVEDKKDEIIPNIEISLEEKKGMSEDLKMLNKKIQNSEGIITLSESDFKSEYGKKRYNELKHIPDGKPVTFNRSELLKIGDEMETALVGKRVKEEIKKDVVEDKGEENLEKNEDIKNIEVKEPFTYKDLSKPNTEFESRDFIFKTISTSKTFFGSKLILVEGIDKKTNKKELYSYREKDLKKSLVKGDIKINKIIKE